jgi:serine/threonine protein kinase
MAPEQVEEPQTVDHRADIYSLGVVFYEMLTGELPLGGFAAPSSKVMVDGRVDEVVRRALEKEPERRYQQASEFQTHLETIAGVGESGAQSPPPARPAAAPARSRRLGGKIAILAGGAAILVLTALAILLPSWLSQEKAPPRPASEKELAARFELALKTRDTNAMSALYYWRGVPPYMKSFQLRMFDGLMKLPANDTRPSVRLGPVPAGSETEMVRDGIRYTPNISVLGVISGSIDWIENGTNCGWSVQYVPYGKKGDVFYLAGTSTTKIYTPKTKDKVLHISVGTSNYQTSVTFKGALAYVQNGRVIQKEISSSRYGGELFFGDYVQSCVVRKTSEDKGSIQLTVYEDGKKLFESRLVETQDPVVYERNGTNSQPNPREGERPAN